ncbi:MAG: hypothetical protein RSB24_08315, partial [Akkermansia sp.]
AKLFADGLRKILKGKPFGDIFQYLGTESRSGFFILSSKLFENPPILLISYLKTKAYLQMAIVQIGCLFAHEYVRED